MVRRPPNKIIAPVLIAGITVGFLASAYKFVFARVKTKTEAAERISVPPDSEQPDSELKEGDSAAVTEENQ